MPRSPLVPVADHVAAVAALITGRPPAMVPLDAAEGLVLADDVVARMPLPPFDNSAMDGYAVRSVDVAGAPVTLPVAGDIPAGRTDVAPLEPGTAQRIMTGALLPAGADAVVPVEDTDAGVGDVRIEAGPAAGTHLRHAGEDVRPGDVVLRAGTVLGPSRIGLLAALGDADVLVHARPRVVVLSTGSELVAPGHRLAPGQIYESNGPMLAAAVRAAGAEARLLRFVPDDVAAFRAAIEDLDADLVLTSGGVSAGAYEVVKDALAGVGVEFVKVAMQPGMPQGAGRYRGRPVVTLPGNPVSSLVSFEVFVRPPLRAALGYPDTHRPVLRRPLAEPIDAPPAKRQFRRGVLGDGTVAPIGPPASHYLRRLADADCLIVVPEDVTHLDAGDEVEVWTLD